MIRFVRATGEIEFDGNRIPLDGSTAERRLIALFIDDHLSLHQVLHSESQCLEVIDVIQKITPTAGGQKHGQDILESIKIRLRRSARIEIIP